VKWLIALLLAGCGGAPAVDWGGAAAMARVPLVDGWRPERPVVEVTIDGQGPYLFVLATGLPESTVLAPLARDLGLRSRPDRDPEHARVGRLEAGDLKLRDLRCRILPSDDAFGALRDRPIAGALGADVLGRGRVEVDPGSGKARLYPPGVDPPPVLGASEVPLEKRDGGWLASAKAGDREVRLWLASESPLSRVRPDPDAPGRQDVSLAGGPPRPVLVLPVKGAPSGVDGVLGGDLLRGLAWRVEPGRLLLWVPEDDPAARVRRFPDVDLTGLRATLVSAGQGRAEIAVAPPAAPLPARYWVRLDAGLPGAPRTFLVRPQPRGGIAVRAVLENTDLAPDRLRAPGGALDVVDVAPLDMPCQGDVCVLY
jgi:hypothetical protein